MITRTSVNYMWNDALSGEGPTTHRRDFMWFPGSGLVIERAPTGADRLGFVQDEAKVFEFISEFIRQEP